MKIWHLLLIITAVYVFGGWHFSGIEELSGSQGKFRAFTLGFLGVGIFFAWLYNAIEESFSNQVFKKR